MPNKRKVPETEDGIETQLIHLSTQLAKKRLEDGSISDTVLVHYLKLGSSQQRAENERLKEQVKLLKAKTTHLENAVANNDKYAKAIEAMRTYSGESERD